VRASFLRFGTFQGLKTGVPNGCLEEISIFKIMIDYVTLNFIYDDIQDISAQMLGGKLEK